MYKNIIRGYFEKANNFSDEEYLFSTIAISSGPTLAGEKPSSLVTLKNSNRNLMDCWYNVREKVKESFNIDYIELNEEEDFVTVLIYNKGILEKILKNDRERAFLKRFGYEEDMELDEILKHLKSRFKRSCPHEVGIFLGYPIADVAMFVHCPNKACLKVGYWKVYHNLEEAECVFEKYDNIKTNIIKLIKQGINPSELMQHRVHFNFNI
ncbi:DUF3793 family protein [Clostridium tetani]|uniref:DUF3793 family protein n=1 Tax=Clostridium tetani TaxID=1513 RepID=A0ABY0ET03_CLOTA|nr:DUF3793 family protein [Clostridium tetani]CDI48492.1 hypothetical protein BN906_00457 [Clostridium tetani 12124569]KHO40236.1 hypothetical protein OR62_02045 [Clostridium tetani]RXI40925.1 DUF3793 family protein [Clostridium tetani]RXI58658.1 DUF3793 family protein [Clostridium tetani]RXI73371.1 DUF3793 family protein [Clostridium tetani]